MPRRMSQSTVLAAFSTMVRFGRGRVKPGVQINIGRALGLALGPCSDYDGGLIMDAAATALEDSNYHIQSHIIAAMRRNDWEGVINFAYGVSNGSVKA
jgi:hypothetical protein